MPLHGGKALLLSLSLITAGANLACGGGQKAAESPSAAGDSPAAIEVERAELPARTLSLVESTSLSDEERLQLAGIVQYQLKRAQWLFETGHTESATDTVIGALLLLQKDDPLASATRGRSSALLEAAHVAARQGDSGRAHALYSEALRASEDAKVQSDIEGHLKAISDWMAATGGASEVQRAGELSRHKLARALVDPSEASFQSAQESVVDWLDAALRSASQERDPRSMAARDDALEAYRAVRSGAPGLVAISLRQGEPLAAVEVLQASGMERALPAGVAELLTEATEKNDPDAWFDLFRIYDTARREDSAEAALPPYVADGAALWAAIGLYRSSPGRLEHAMPLSMLFMEFGMPEVSAALMSKTVSEESAPEALSWSLSLVLRGLLALGQSDQLEAARQAYQEARPLLELADSERFAGSTPGSAGVTAFLAALEVRFGHAAKALPLLAASVEVAPTPDTLLRLAELNRQAGKPADALSALEAAVSLAAKRGDVLTEARAEEQVFLLQQGLSRTEAANAALRRSLERVLAAKDMDLSLIPPAAVERQLARLMQHYGRSREARRAYERALTASRQNPGQLPQTLTDMARSAVISQDIRLARSATRAALDLSSEPQDLIYLALWQRLVELRTHTPSDGLVDQALAASFGLSGWPALLRDFAQGQLPAKQLLAQAKTIPEKAEAKFYTSLFAAKDGPLPQAALEEVGASPAIDLVEVSLARALINKTPAPVLPSDLRLH